MKNLVGKIIENRYKIVSIIGIGGMAIVYKAVDTITGNSVAVKVLKQEYFEDEQFRARFENESRAISMLNHENIVKIYDVGLGDELYYIVMEYVDGITLKQFIEQEKVIPWKSAVYFTVQILNALAHAHSMGVIHRDIKPQNIMLLSNGSIRVTDFGIARISTKNTNTISEKAIGSVHYISPEQVSGGKTDYRSDIYSVGVMLYEMLTGKTPFDAESPVSVALMQVQSAPKRPSELNPDILPGLEDITLKAMNKNADLRYQSAEEMLEDIEKFKKDPSIEFDYKYGNDDNPTMYLDAINTVKENQSKKDKKLRSYMGTMSGVLAAFILVIAVIGVVAAFIVPRVTSSTVDVAVPTLVGQQYSELLAAQNPDITIVVESEEYDDEVEEGYIISQDPEEGMTIKKGREVRIVVSKGAKSIEIEDFADKDYRTARLKLEALGLVVSKQEEYSDTVAAGYVIRTEPEKGEMVGEGDAVAVYISLGKEPQMAAVENVTGLSEQEAVNMLTAAGFVPVVRSSDSDQPAGIVIAQSVLGGQEAEQGSQITLTVSNGANAAKQKEITLVIPTREGSYTVTVRMDSQTVYEGTHSNDNRVVKVTLSGSGSKMVEVYVDGTLQNSLSGFVSFDD